MGETTVAVEAFEGNNLLLVDEGHRGATWVDEHGDRFRSQGSSALYTSP